MLQITHKIVGSKMRIWTIYNPVLIAACRAVGGRFYYSDEVSGYRGCWVVPKDQGLRIVDDLYGLSAETVLAVIPRDKCVHDDGMCRIGGYLLATRKRRDAQAVIHADLVRGTIPPYGGSTKHPGVNPSEDAIFEMELRADFAHRKNLEITIEGGVCNLDPNTADTNSIVFQHDASTLVGFSVYQPPEVCETQSPPVDKIGTLDQLWQWLSSSHSDKISPELLERIKQGI